MPSFADLLADFEKDQSCASAAGTLLEIRRLAGVPEPIGLTKVDALLSILQPVVSAAAELDKLNLAYWNDLQHKITEIRGLLRSRYQAASLWESTSPKPQKIRVGEYPKYTSLTSPAPPEAGNRLLPLKALLLIADYSNRRFNEESTSDRFESRFRAADLKDLADRLRKYSDPSWQHFHLLLENVPEWTPEDVEGWAEAFRSNVRKLPRSGGTIFYSGIRDHLFVLSAILRHVTDPLIRKADAYNSVASQQSQKTEDDSSNNFVVRSTPPDLQFNPITGHEVRAKPSFHTYTPQRSTTEEIGDAEAPEMRSAVPQEGIGADEPEQTQSVAALNVRYTNYRTAMDNQRLPWTWDCCNPLEVRFLVRALTSALTVPDKDDARGRLLVWLTLLTGQPLAEILDFVVSNHAALTDCNGLIQGRYWRRQIPSPPQAYTPKLHHVDHLYAHKSTVDFELPEPVTQLTAALGLQQISRGHSQNIVRLRNALSIDSKKAEQLMRTLLELLRGRDHRLLVGRVRKVLGKEVMCVCQSPVLTHLITASATDAPPSGVYYSAFPIERLQAIYNEAINRITRGIQ